MIITIDGVAGAGKTSLAAHLAEEYSPKMSVQVVHMDDLYDGWDDSLGESLTAKLSEIIAAHKAKAPYRTRAFDWNTGGPGDEIVIGPADLLILEGVGAGARVTRDEAVSKIWIDIEPIVGLRRVLSRDGEAIEAQMLHFMELQRAHHLQEGTRDAADFHLNGL